jgi:hypothetical protein
MDFDLDDSEMFNSVPITSLASPVSPATLSSKATEFLQSDEIATPLETAHEKTKSAYDELISCTFEHKSMVPRVWCVEVSTLPELFGSKSKIQFSRILKYDTLVGPLFVFAERAQPVTSQSIHQLSGDTDISVSRTSAETATVTLERLLNPPTPHASWPRIIISNDLFSNDDCLLVVQYKTNRTLKLTKKDFDAITKRFPSYTGPLDAIPISVLPTLEELTMEEWKDQVVGKLHMLEDTQVCLADSHKLQSDIVRAEYAHVTDIIQRQTHGNDEIRETLESIWKAVVRLHLTINGPPR